MYLWRVKLCSRGVRLRIYMIMLKQRHPGQAHQSDPPREVRLSCIARAMHAFEKYSSFISFARFSCSRSAADETIPKRGFRMMPGMMPAPAPAVRAAVSAGHAAGVRPQDAWTVRVAPSANRTVWPVVYSSRDRRHRNAGRTDPGQDDSDSGFASLLGD